MALEKQQARRRPPRLANALLRGLLRSPFHGLVSQQIMLITFRGRKSGKSFSTPVGYARKDGVILFFTDHPWWKNLLKQEPVILTIQGQRIQGIPEVIVDDRAHIAGELKQYVEQRPAAARAYGITLDEQGQARPDTVQQAAQRFVLVRVHPS